MKRAVPLFLLIAVAAVYRKVLFGGEMFFFADIATQNYPWKMFFAEQIRAGALPVWFPFMHSGFPLYAEIQAGSFYPPNWLFFSLLPLPLAYAVVQSLHLFLCGGFLYLLAREWGEDRGPALFAALGFILSGFFVTHLVHLSMYLTACWLPLELLLLEKALKKEARFWLLMLCPVLALQILAGHPQIVAFSVLALFFRLLAHLAAGPRPAPDPGRWQWLGLGAGVVVFSLALSGIQLLPTAELVQHSVRSGGIGPDLAGEHSMPPWTLLLYLFPDLFGFATPDRNVDFWLYGLNYWEICPYAGVLPLLLAMVPLLQRPLGSWKFFYVLLLFSLVMMLGDFTPLYGLFKQIPPFYFFRAPCRFILLATLSLALLSGHGLHLLLRAENGERDRLIRFLTWGSGLTAAFVLATGAAGSVALTVFRAPVRDLLMRAGSEFVRERIHAKGPFLKPLAYYQEKLAWAVDTILDRLGTALDLFRPGMIVPLALLLLFFLCLLLFRKRVLSGRGFFTGCLLLLVLDLGIFGFAYNPTLPQAEALAPSPVAARLQSEPGRFRVLRDVRSIPEGIREDKALLPACIGAVWGIRCSDQFTPLALGRYVDLLQVIGQDPGYILNGELSHRNLAGLLGTRYLLSEQPVRGLAREPGDPAAGVSLYRNPEPFPLLFFVSGVHVEPDRKQALAWMADPHRDFSRTVLLEEKPPYDPAPLPQADARIQGLRVSASEDRVEAAVTVSDPGVLVLTVCHYPGWTVRVDGKPCRLFRADYTYQGVFLEPGRHTVSFRFVPPGLVPGACITGVSALVWALLLLRGFRRRRRAGNAHSRLDPRPKPEN
jgi:hypothetical protein